MGKTRRLCSKGLAAGELIDRPVCDTYVMYDSLPRVQGKAVVFLFCNSVRTRSDLYILNSIQKLESGSNRVKVRHSRDDASIECP